MVLTAAYTYSDFQFEDFRLGAEDFGGNTLPGVPPHQLYGRLHYEGSGFSGTLRVTTADEYFVDNANRDSNDGYTVVDLRVGYAARLPGIQAKPFLGLNNIFDTRYNSSVVVNAIAGRYYEPAPGRNIYLGLRMTTR